MSSTPPPPPDPLSVAEGYEDWKRASVSPILLTTLAELARIAARGASTGALLAELTQLTMLATTVDGVGAMSCTDTRVTFVHADSPRTSTVDRLQERLQQGPCSTSVQTQRPVAVPDFAEPSARQQWPDLAPAALDVGLHSTLAVPLLARGRAWGVLDIYRDQPHRWTFADLLVSKTLADVVVSLLVLATDLENARAETHHRGAGSVPGAGASQVAPTDDSDVATSSDLTHDAGGTVRVDLLRATLDARLERLNTRLKATRMQLPKSSPPTGH